MFTALESEALMFRFMEFPEGQMEMEMEMFAVENVMCTCRRFINLLVDQPTRPVSVTEKHCLLCRARSLSHQIIAAILQHADWRPYLAADADMLDLCQRDTQAGLPGCTFLIL